MTPRQPWDLEQALRAAFEAEAERVQVAPDALVSIRSRISARSARWRWRFNLSLASAATAVAATVVAVTVGVVSCQPPGRQPIPPGGPTTTGVRPSTVGTAASASPTGQPVTASAPVYLTGDVEGTPLLYREFHTLPVGDGSIAARIRAALGDTLAGRALDPDYGTLWTPGATVGSVQLVGQVAVVNLVDTDPPSGTGSPGALPAAAAQAMVQQVVYTATAVAADRGVQLTGVRLRFAGVTRSVYRGADVSGTLTRSPVVAPIWLISPQQGQHVTRTFTVSLAGVVYEATMRLRVRDTHGTVVTDQQVILSVSGPNQGTASVSVTLPPGAYTLEAYTNSAKDGHEIDRDDHEIVVG
jgi:immunoglobulin-like protein involved in spore germination/sporulation and spore germination protein